MGVYIVSFSQQKPLFKTSIHSYLLLRREQDCQSNATFKNVLFYIWNIPPVFIQGYDAGLKGGIEKKLILVFCCNCKL
jgi:hypothetical protein